MSKVVHRRELAGDADRGADRIGIPRQIMPGDLYVATVGADQRGQDPHRGGLAGTVGSEQREDRPLGDMQIDAVEHHLLAKRLLQPGCHDRPLGSGGSHAPSFSMSVALVATTSPSMHVVGFTAVSSRFQVPASSMCGRSTWAASTGSFWSCSHASGSSAASGRRIADSAFHERARCRAAYSRRGG